MRLLTATCAIAFVITVCNADIAKNSHDCTIIRRTLKQCYPEEKWIYFMQSSPQKIAQFSRNNSGFLKVECYTDVGVLEDKIPKIDFSEVKELEVYHCNFPTDSVLTRMKENFNLTSLETLKIRLNEKRSFELSAKLFEKFSGLENMEIISSDYVNYDENVFKVLKNLKSLKLLGNDITTLPYNVFKPLGKLEELSIVNSGRMKNETKTLNITLKWCINLQRFHMSGVRWPIHINNLLTNNGFLKRIEIVGNKLESINKNVFKGSTEIEEISLARNEIRNLSESIFATQSDVIKIDLSQNQLESLDDGIFAENYDLEVIDLSQNRLTFTSSKLFSHLEYLTELNLEHNNLPRFIFPTYLGVSNSLAILRLSHNKIEELEGHLQCSNLTRLDLSHNKLKRFFVQNFLEPTQFDLNVNLMQNRLESVDFRDTTNQTRDSRLLINLGDEITCNCHTISFYNFLHRNLNNSMIYEAVQVSPRDVKCIQDDENSPETVLQIDNETLTCQLDFPHQVFCPKHCKCIRRPAGSILMISCKEIQHVPILPPYRMLKDVKLNKVQLSIVGNQIRELPNKFIDSNYNDVTHILASYNIIRKISPENLPDHLETLDLRHNQLQHISPVVIERFSSLSLVQLSFNPWNCTKSVDLVIFATSHRKVARDFNVMQCTNGQYFLEVELHESCHGSIFIAVFGLLALVLIVALIFIYRRKREAITEWIFQNDKHHFMERLLNKMKLFDAIVVTADLDKVFAKYLTTKLMTKPNQFKIGMFVKDWSPDDAIPPKVLKSLHNSRRVIVILSDHFDEENWMRWNYFSIGTRIIFVVKGRKCNSLIEISNASSIQFNDPWFWDKMKYSMVKTGEMKTEEQCDVEMQALECEV